MKILVSGFEPFHTNSENPSIEVIRNLILHEKINSVKELQYFSGYIASIYMNNEK